MSKLSTIAARLLATLIIWGGAALFVLAAIAACVAAWKGVHG